MSHAKLTQPIGATAMLPRTADGFVLDDEGFAIPAADLLADFFAEHTDDPDEGDPTDWPEWTDDDCWQLGHSTRSIP